MTPALCLRFFLCKGGTPARASPGSWNNGRDHTGRAPGPPPGPAPVPGSYTETGVGQQWSGTGWAFTAQALDGGVACARSCLCSWHLTLWGNTTKVSFVEECSPLGTPAAPHHSAVSHGLPGPGEGQCLGRTGLSRGQAVRIRRKQVGRAAPLKAPQSSSQLRPVGSSRWGYMSKCLSPGLGASSL